jgi:multiple sugar transport system substrate-binding protein
MQQHSGLTIIDRRTLLKAAAALGASTAFGGNNAFAQGGELSLWTPGGSPLFCDIQTGLLGKWSGPKGITPAITCGQGQNTEYTQSLMGAVAAGNPPSISMLWESPIALGSQGAFMPIDDMLAKSSVPVATWPGQLLKSCQFRDKTYGLPVTAGVYGMWYNEEMFEAKGMKSDRDSFPKTWDEMRKISKEFTRWEGDRLETAGFMPPRAAESLPVWSALNGGKIFDSAAMKYSIDAPENIAMFEWFVSWLDEEYKGNINLIDRSGNFIDGYPSSSTGLAPAFREGRLAAMESGSWLMGDIWADPVPSFTRWNIAPHPVGPSGTTSVSGIWPNWFVIPVGSKDPQAAFDYLAWLSTEGVVNWFEQIPDVPTNTQVKAIAPKVVVEKRGAEFANDIAAFLQKQVGATTAMWDSPVQGFANDQLGRAIEKIYTKAEAPKVALAAAQTATDAELQRVLAN